MKCGLCGKEVDEQPMIIAECKCSVCGAKLKVALSDLEKWNLRMRPKVPNLLHNIVFR